VTTTEDRITAWEAKQRARLAWAEREVERAYKEKIAAQKWHERCWSRVGRLEECIERLERLYDLNDEDEIIRAKLTLARDEVRRAWITAVRADFRRERADCRLRRALATRDEASYNLSLLNR